MKEITIVEVKSALRMLERKGFKVTEYDCSDLLTVIEKRGFLSKVVISDGKKKVSGSSPFYLKAAEYALANAKMLWPEAFENKE